MPISCQHKARHGRQFCVSDCPASIQGGVFEYARVEKPGDLPAYDPLAVDVPILDMNHGWPNLGHDCLVHVVAEAVCDLAPELERAGLQVRVLSYEVRRRGMLPEPPPGRFLLYLGTGGPGDLDPRRNDGVSPGAQGIHEDPGWERPLFALFDAVQRDGEAALLAVCHSFGLLCRWSGAAAAVLRGAEKGGKSSGLLENLLTDAGRTHPWFGRFAGELPEGRRLRVMDNRLFDLLPGPAGLPDGLVAIGCETRGVGGPAGDAVTMIEFARDAAGLMPRIFGVNHHPEIVDRARQMMILADKRERGEVTAAWYEERAALLTRSLPGEDSDRRLQLTSDYTLRGPLRYHLCRQARRRAGAIGAPWQVHEDEVLAGPPVAP